MDKSESTRDGCTVVWIETWGANDIVADGKERLIAKVDTFTVIAVEEEEGWLLGESARVKVTDCRPALQKAPPLPAFIKRGSLVEVLVAPTDPNNNADEGTWYLARVTNFHGKDKISVQLLSDGETKVVLKARARFPNKKRPFESVADFFQRKPEFVAVSSLVVIK